MVKLAGKNGKKQKSPARINYKGESSNFIAENLADSTLTKQSNLTSLVI